MSSGGNIYAISMERFRAKVVNVPLGGAGGGGGGSGSSSSSLMSDAAATGSPMGGPPPTEPLAIDDRVEIEPGMTLQIVEQPSSKIALIKVKDFNGTSNGSSNRLGAPNSSSSSGMVATSAPVSNPYENRVLQCQSAHLQRIPSDIWPYLIAILDPLERCEFAKRPKLFGSVKQLRVGDIVMVSWLAKNRHVTYDCIIRYVGPVPKIGPGYYFGLELLNLDNGESPQKDDIDFVSEYMNCEPRLALIVAANWIKFPEHESSGGKQQHHHKRNLLDSLVCGARDLNNRLSRRTGSSKHSADDNSSSKGGGRSGKGGGASNGEYPPYARSYTPDLTSSGQAGAANRKSTDIGTLYDSFSCLQMDPAGAKAMHHHKKIAASISSPNLSKQDSSSSTGSSGRYVTSHPMESYGDEYHRFVDQHSAGQQQQQHQHHHHHHLADGGDAYRSSGRSSQNSSNSSTLKHSKARTAGKVARSTGSNSSVNSAGGGGGGAGAGGGYHSVSKQSTILSLPDRDVVVIDSNEIDEAIKSASDVIVVDPPPVLSPTDNREVELMDLLGSSSWPAEAGEVAAILSGSGSSSDKKTQTPPSSMALGAYGNGTAGYAASGGSTSSNSTANSSGHSYHSHNGSSASGRYERNKSLNPLAHIGMAKQQGEPVASGVRKGGRAGDAKPATVDVATMTKLNDGAAITANGSIGPADGTSHPTANGLVPRIGSISPESDSGGPAASPLQELPNDPSLGVGSMVEVTLDGGAFEAPGAATAPPATMTDPLLYGVIRWIGPLPTGGGNHRKVMVGVELEDEPIDPTLETTNGTHNGVRLFRCPANRAIFVHTSQCSRDRRFQDIPPMSPCSSRTTPAAGSGSKTDTNMFGKVDCPVVKGRVPPLKILKLEELEEICGKFKGIQGHHNSCYLDATLFAMFTFTSVFDSLLFRPKEPEDNPQYEEVQRVLLEEIVNPLRKNHFVRADRVLKLRQLLDRLSSVTGLMSEEKDPEEFLNSLLAQILRADPFLKLSSGLDTFYYQLFVEKDERLNLPSVQQLFEQSFLASNIKLKEVPSCLIIQMPRFGKNFKMYPRILPSQVLDVTDIIEDSPRQCWVCGKLAEYECRECFGKMQCEGLEGTAICKSCIDSVHHHSKRLNHKPVPLSVPQDFIPMAPHCEVPRLYMELFAVVCIETSHYVAFVKAASGQDAPWCFFDSMADRNGEQNGYNIPKMVPVPDLPRWLTEEGSRALNEEAVNDKMLPEHAKRLLCDAYMCMYQSTDVMMYR
uniref:ubiquitinyl hydrolase 1 n=2 Tax=Anopheles coluzzii TaxID=1518534 RepID=A0A6E8VWY1_ANOCL|nr:ubiquitin carboxyl-terminal hydrolase CYLD isoform X1 [Anopheles coluzzii]XP_040232994.2 ubiquitin carboxyl-terminal hydrolase CYLD isoform X1 [Anopheles coluzzii]XP_040232995.2 ubiquitin carboxyl-terminal hydrolase CYLD isoform X1 [Anopheles coluzzii]XP_049464193.1 ubiquitin carboxyl-terminal hydrolase CYLD isoform X1 [Anopheles coluzzii]